MAPIKFSDLSRDSKRVAEAADRGPVTITRRDGETLVLRRQQDVERERAGVAAAIQVITAAVAGQPTSFVERLKTPFPWITLLPEGERDEFAAELIDISRACAAVSAFDPLLTLIHAWSSTAEAYATGYTTDSDLEWLTTPEPVERPTD